MTRPGPAERDPAARPGAEGRLRPIDPGTQRLRRARMRAIDLYVATVSAAGVIVFVALAATGGVREIGRAPGTFWLLGALAVIGELFPIRLPRHQDVEEVTTSTTFGFAIMLGWGTGAAVVAMVAAVLAADTGRKPPWKMLFNIAGYVLSMAAAGGVYAVLGGSAVLVAGDLVPIVASGIAFFLVNTAVVEVAVALSQNLPPLHHLRRHLAFQSVTAGVLLSLGPVVVVVAQHNPTLLPLLALPVASVHWSARTSVENTELTELNRLKDDLVAVVSHELRTPLTSIQGYVKTLLQLGDQLDAEQSREFLEGAARQSDRLQRLIEELLDAARLDANAESIEVTTVDLSELAHSVVNELRDRSPGHTIALTFDQDLPVVRTDAAKVHRILSNLVENALKYTPPGTYVWIQGRATDRGETLSVEDQGPGIPLDSQERVFERFFQVDQTPTRSVGGTGLGLYICRRLADAIGGELTLDRSSEAGSVFTLRIPWEPPRSPATRTLVPRREPATRGAA